MKNKTQIQNIVKSQQPLFVRESYPEFINFLKEYYKSVEYRGGPVDIINNINEYSKLQNISELIYSTKLTKLLNFDETVIEVENTDGFPDRNSLLQIDEEIIFYEYKTKNQFFGCKRGFSGVTSYEKSLDFNTSLRDDHLNNSTVHNLNALLLLELYKKFKSQYTPGFEEIDFYDELNENILVSRIKDFYSSKGSDKSFNILFKIVWGVDVSVIKPRDFLIQASDADYRITRDLVAQRYEGDPLDIANRTLFQDVNGILQSSFGTVVKVESIIRNDEEYFQLSLDYNPDVENFAFEVHAKTKTTDFAKAGQTYLDVDSTKGFDESGFLEYYNNGVKHIIEYTSKNLTQFFGVILPTDIPVGSNIFDRKYAYVFDDDGNQIKIKITGVLGDLTYDRESSKYYQEGDQISIISLGKDSSEKIHNSWLLNLSPEYDVLTLSKVSEKLNGVSQYRVTTYDETIFKVGDRCLLESNDGQQYEAFVISVLSKTVFDVNISINLNTLKKYIVKRKISKADTVFNPELKIISSDVSNVYIDGDDTYVTSTCFPSYYQRSLSFNKISKNFSTTLTSPKFELVIGSHPFVTGDSIYYSYNNNPGLNISEGQYFVYKVSDSVIKLASSRSNIRNGIFISLSGNALNNEFLLLRFWDKNIKPQNIIRKFRKPIDETDEKEKVTNPGPIGLFLNGVELINSKSSDAVYYGPLEQIVVSSPGDSNYDIINPPVLEIVDNIGNPGESGFGTDAYGVCNVKGSLSRIDVLDSGFDYIKEPEITITGGNGSGAKCKCNLTSIKHFKQFNAGSQYNQVNITNNTITFSNDHRFKNYEKVIYNNENQTLIGGLVDGSIYYVNTIDSKVIKLHNSFEDSLVGINTIEFSSYGEGLQKITSVEPKKIIKSVDVLEKGSGYTNKTLYFTQENINLQFNYLEIENHGYSDKEIVLFNTDGSLPSGISSSSEYYVKTIDSNKFKIYEISGENGSFNYDNNIFVNISSYGSGIHNVKYLPIEVKIEAPIGITTFTGQNLTTKIVPIFTGEIFSVSLKNKGSNYGDKTIINYNRQPEIKLLNGSGAKLDPIISSSGKIIGVIIINGGSNYNSYPLINVYGSGYNAKLIPVLKNGRIDDVIILDSGRNYSKEDTYIEVISNGYGAQFQSIIKSWNINLVERLFDTFSITTDDGVIVESLDPSNEIEYCHAFTPRGIREQCLATSLDSDGNIVYKSDILNDDDTLKYHSPIIGWAYDGNPIYGPYGYDLIQGGNIRKMKSGYAIRLKPNRPPQSIFPSGYFVEDYEFTNSGDLDEHNGRFCKTPEFPNGVYAYFSSFSETKDSVGAYNGFLRPIYPYVIGPTFKSKPIEYNFDIFSNQYRKSIDDNWIRFTSYLGLLKEKTRYRSVTEPNIFTRVLTSINSTSTGSLDSLKVVFGGENYSVGDKIYFNSRDTFGFGAYASVKNILGSVIENISYNYYKLNDVSFAKYNNSGSYIGFANTYHNLRDVDSVVIDNSNILSTKFNGKVNSIYIPEENILTILSNFDDTSVTGIITYIPVSGNLSKNTISIDDIYTSNSEKFKVLNIYTDTSFLRVEREYFGSISTDHSYGDPISELSRKIIINTGFTTENNYHINDNYYFNPKESVIIPSENLLLYSEPISTSLIPSSPWNVTGTIVSNVEYNQKSPLPNSLSSVKISLGSTIGSTDSFFYNYSSVSLSNQENTFSVFLRGETGGEMIYIIMTDGLIYYSQLVSLTKEWKRYVLTSTTSAGLHNVGIGAFGSQGLLLNQQPTIYASGFQVESGNIASPYYKTYNTTLSRSDNKSGLLYINNLGMGIVSIDKCPSNTIFLPNHNFKTNDSIIYEYPTSDTGIKVSYASTSENLSNSKKLYVLTYNSNFIGLSTQQVGIGSTGEFVGLGTQPLSKIEFINYGSGENHLIKGNKSNTLIADVYKKYATVETQSSHNLEIGDNVEIDAKPNTITNIKVVYNDSLRRMVINPLNFLANAVNVEKRSVNISNHGFKTGQKVVYNSENPSLGLINSNIYYIVVIDSDNIGFSNNYYDEVFSLSAENLIDIKTQEDGTILSINPEITVAKNQTIKFDLSSDTLQFNGTTSFLFNLYYDSDFNNRYYSSSDQNEEFNVLKVGNIGFEGSYLELTIDDNTPDNLFYNLEPINLSTTPLSKLKIESDSVNITNPNRITIKNSIFSRNAKVIGITSNTFDYSLDKTPENSSYSITNGLFKYITTSKTAFGPINQTQLESGGRNYRNLPYVSEILSEFGTKGIILPSSNNIGKVNSVVLQDIGFDYPSDKTLKPSAVFPITYKVEPLSKFEEIKIVDFGVNYFVPPQLVVIDGFTNRVNDEVSLTYDIGDVEVTVRRNTTGLYNVTPTILPVNNPNGIRISNITYDQADQKVTVSFAVTFSSAQDYPFVVGDSVIIENTNINLNVGGKGYNSSAYNYKLFQIIEADPDIDGETPTISYSLKGLLKSGENPGIFDEFESFGTATPKSYFPTFSVKLQKDAFKKGETVKYGDNEGIVQSYDPFNEYIKILSKKPFSPGDVIYGLSSKNLALLSDLSGTSGSYNISANSIVEKGWKKETGRLNNSFQRLHDNDYYQYFSYSVRSPIEFNQWNSLVSNLTHTSGFKKFSEVTVDSFNPNLSGISTNQNENLVTAISNLSQSVDINFVKDFDIAREKTIKVDDALVSNEILFNLPFLAEYKEFIGNRVLTIDDISDQFDNQRMSFELKENNNPIFEVEFDATDSTKVSSTKNQLNLSNHYFVSGEEVKYTPPGNDFNNAIQIAPTNFPGIGITSRLPSRFYVIKDDNQKIGIAATIGDALTFNPKRVDIIGVGAGNTNHKISSLDANNRLLITINEYIQSPLVGSGITLSNTNSVGIGVTDIIVDDITFLSSSDLLKIDDEIIIINRVDSSTNSINVKRSWVGTAETTHSANLVIQKLSGNFNIVDNTINFPEPIWGNIPVGFGTTATSSNEIDYTGLTTSSRFSGRVFLRSALNFIYTTDYVKAYDNNYVYDDISSQFNGITTTFNLKYQEDSITDIPYTNSIILIDGIFQGPQKIGTQQSTIRGDYKLFNDLGDLKIGFNGNDIDPILTKDINVNNVPKGGIIVSVGSTSGFGYQPLISAGGTAIINGSGSVTSISIGNSGSGYRSGIQTVNVGLRTTSDSVINVGFANVNGGYITSVTITNPGSNYDQNDPPEVIFDAPLSYYNIPLIYKDGYSGIGTEASVNIIPSLDGSILSFEIINYGYGYKEDEVLTVSIGGTVGIPTLTGIPEFREFEITVDEVYASKFSGWNVGEFLVIDDVSKYFNGVRRLFPLKIDGDDISFYAKTSSGINLQSNLLVFVNDILQTPGEGYQFTGGSRIRFTEAPKGPLVGFSTIGDTVKILVYTGTEQIDVKTVKVLPSLKIGDNVQLYSNIDSIFTEEERLVMDIPSADTIITNNYADVGVVLDELYERPISWFKQTEDIIIDNKFIGKDRVYYEPIINPSTNILEPIGLNSTEVYVYSTRSLFDDSPEGISPEELTEIEIIPTDTLISAEAVSVLDANGSISNVLITNPGFGYTFAPEITIQKPYIDGSQAICNSTIGAGGIVNTISVSVGGTNYIHGPINDLSVIQQGSGFPSIAATTSTMVRAKLKSQSGIGNFATVTVKLNPNTYIIESTTIENPGINYSVNDVLILDVFDHPELDEEFRRWPLGSPIKFKVDSIKPPPVLIAPPKRSLEETTSVIYEGDYGIIVGVSTSPPSGLQYYVDLDLYIPLDSRLREYKGIYQVGISTGDLFNITNSTFGSSPRTSLRVDGTTTLGISTQYSDMTLQCYDWVEKTAIIPSAISGLNVGITTVVKSIKCIFLRTGTGDIVGSANTAYYGNYTWGKVTMPRRSIPVEFDTKSSYYQHDIVANPVLRRKNPLKYDGYFV